MARLSRNYQAVLKSVTQSEKLASVSEGAALAYHALLCVSDDLGRYYGAAVMAGPGVGGKRYERGLLTAQDVEERLADLERVGLIVRWEAEGSRHLQIVDYWDPTHPQRRIQRHPDPPADLVPGAVAPAGANARHEPVPSVAPAGANAGTSCPPRPNPNPNPSSSNAGAREAPPAAPAEAVAAATPSASEPETEPDGAGVFHEEHPPTPAGQIARDVFFGLVVPEAGVAGAASVGLCPVLREALERGWTREALEAWIRQRISDATQGRNGRKRANPAGLLRHMLEHDLPTAAPPPKPPDPGERAAKEAQERAERDRDRKQARRVAEAERVAGIGHMRLAMHAQARGSGGDFAREHLAKNRAPSDQILAHPRTALAALAKLDTAEARELAQAIDSEVEARGRAKASSERHTRKEGAMHAPSKGGKSIGGGDATLDYDEAALEASASASSPPPPSNRVAAGGVS